MRLALIALATLAYPLLVWLGMAHLEPRWLAVGLDMSVLADQIVVRLGGMFVAALQIAGPLMAVLFLVDVGFGLLSRAAPALNAFALGFPMKIFTTLMLGATLLVALPSAVGAISESALDALVAVFP